MTVLSRIVGWLSDPRHLAFTVLVVGVALLFTRRWRMGRALVAVCVLGALVLQPVPLGAYLVRLLESRFPPPTSLPERIDGIVLLGGDFHPVLVARHGPYSLGRHGGQRVAAFVDLARRYPEARLYFTGGVEFDVPGLGTWNEAHAARLLFEARGLDPRRVIHEDRARNTFENATLTHALARPNAGETWVLVTMARHMPRAVGSFRRAGWTVTPYPVDFRVPVPVAWGEIGWSFDFGLTMIEEAMHELVGLVSYRLLDRTDALFPGP
jgi:uncharacterized SAM-binding protein YcdF (DUF218 family)